MEVKRAIEDFVNDLDHPYKYLKENGYKGYRGDPCHCPLARCLRDEFIKDNNEGWVRVDVSPLGIYIKRYKPTFDVEALAIPQHIIDFIEDFDDGHYPELELDRISMSTESPQEDSHYLP